jgi:hypothetical protein
MSQKSLTPTEVEEALRTGRRLNKNDFVTWHDGKGNHHSTVGDYVELQQRAETEREIEQEMRKVKKRKKERAKLIQRARTKAGA